MERYSIWLLRAPKAEAYIATIRNPRKKQYAEQYLHWLCNPRVPDPVEDGLSYMAAQAVRMNIRQIMEVKREERG
jgi:hypothetical protein